MHSSAVVANYLLQLAREAKTTLSPMQLLKLVFLCHGWMLGLYGRPLVREEIQAWKYGPVIPDLYKEISHYRSNPVTQLIRPRRFTRLNRAECDVIKQVFDIYGKFDGITLSKMTHEVGSPWDLTFRQGMSDLAISNDLIENHYGAMARRGAAN